MLKHKTDKTFLADKTAEISNWCLKFCPPKYCPIRYTDIEMTLWSTVIRWMSRDIYSDSNHGTFWIKFVFVFSGARWSTTFLANLHCYKSSFFNRDLCDKWVNGRWSSIDVKDCDCPKKKGKLHCQKCKIQWAMIRSNVTPCPSDAVSRISRR